MQPIRSCATVAGILTAVLSTVAAAYADTFVSDSGNDGNSCLSIAAPCRQIGGATGALAKINEGGVVHVLPGNYSGFIVDKAVEIIADAGQAAITSPIEIPSGGGFTEVLVEAGPDDEVRIRGFILDGAGIAPFGSSHGVTFFSGASLHLENCTLVASALSHGVAFLPTGASELYVLNCAISGNGSASGGGIIIRPSGSGSAGVVIDNVRLENNFSGVSIDGTATSGTIRATVRNSTMSGNNGFGLRADESGGGTTNAMLESSTASNNGTNGVVAVGSNAIIRMRNSTSTGNAAKGLASLGGGQIVSHGGNVVAGNTANGSFTGSFAQQ